MEDEISTFGNPFHTSGRVPPEKYIVPQQFHSEALSLIRSGQNVSIEGPSGIGKSSFLNYLCRPNNGDLDGLDSLLIDLQGVNDDQQFWERIHPVGYEGAVKRLDDKSRPLLLCIDEIDRVAEASEFSPDFWHQLRALGQEQHVIIVTASRSPLAEIQPPTGASPFYNIFQSFQMPGFTESEAHALFAHYLPGNPIQFEESQIQKLVHEYGESPADLQKAASELYAHLVKVKREEIVVDADGGPPGGPPSGPDESSAGDSNGGDADEDEHSDDGNDEEFEAGSNLASDAATDEDAIWGGAYVDALADFLNNEDTKPPLVIGVNAPWGNGKSSLMLGLKKKLSAAAAEDDKVDDKGPVKTTMRSFLKSLAQGATSDDLPTRKPKGNNDATPTYETVWFNAWKYSSDEQVWAALVKTVIGDITDRMTAAERENFLLQLNLKRIDGDKIRMAIYQFAFSRILPWAVAGILFLVFLYIMVFLLPTGALGNESPLIDAIARHSVTGGSAAFVCWMIAFWKFALRKPLPLKVADYVKQPKYNEKIGFLQEVEDDFRRIGQLLEKEKRQLVIFVDDLDRCSPGKVVEVIEAINIFIGGAGAECYVVIGLDSDVVATSIEVHYSKLVNAMKDKPQRAERASTTFGQEFLRKIVQVGLTLPEPTSEQLCKTGYLTGLMGGLPVEDPPPPPLSVEQTELIRRRASEAANVTDAGSADAAVGEELTDDQSEAARAVAATAQARRFTESDEEVRGIIEEALAYLDLRPRHLKLFLNRFRLTTLIRLRRHQQPITHIDTFRQLAKWTALSIQHPGFLRLVFLDPDALKDVQDAALQSGDDDWVSECAREDRKLFIDDRLRSFLKQGVCLTSDNLDFAALV